MERQAAETFRPVSFSIPAGGECKWQKREAHAPEETFLELSDLVLVPWAPADRQLGVVLRVTHFASGKTPEIGSFWLPVSRGVDGAVDGPGIFDLSVTASPAH